MEHVSRRKREETVTLCPGRSFDAAFEESVFYFGYIFTGIPQAIFRTFDFLTQRGRVETFDRVRPLFGALC